MNIYKISQEVNNYYDTYDSFVVYAKNEENARHIHPLEPKEINWRGSWVKNPEDIEVEYLGVAKEGAKEGEILGSFNAG